MEQNENQRKGFVCTGDCLMCSSAQRQYCASQNAYKNMMALQALSEELAELIGKLEAIQNNEALVYAPVDAEEEDTEEEEEKAQKASGAESKLPRKSNN